MRRMMLRACAPILVVGSLLLAPASASAFVNTDPFCTQTDSRQLPCNTRVDTLATWRGWGSTSVHCPGGAHPPEGWVQPVGQFRAWRWTSRGWSGVTIPEGRLYIHPFAVGWSWVWRQETGWLAMQDSLLYVNFSCGIPRP